MNPPARYDADMLKTAARQPYELCAVIHDLLQVLMQSTATAARLGLIERERRSPILLELEGVQEALHHAGGPPLNERDSYAPDDPPDEIPPLLSLYWNHGE
ncbi:MAG: hypothetical protein F4013_03690 [Gammaproteobacteria bacterium]|nr:hypothetical protein [Gammaproteobacteria bacterium]